ncbi:SpoIIE family protein phosphatase [Kitasatospora sp. NA04385]|nr:SpoIIE family protein phosphatase [Kitasatospora sp. NA04385]
MDTGPEEVFDDLASLAARITGAGRAFVTLVDADRSFWKSSIGVDLPDLADRQGPLSASYCPFVVGTADAFVVDDAARDPRTAHHPATHPMHIGAWAGQPLLDADGHVLGTLCVIDDDPRPWSDADIATLATLARSVSAEINLRQALTTARHAHRRSADLARTLQAGLLPDALRTVPGLEAAASYLPASRRDRADIEVGGDFYDLFPTHGDNWGAVMGDVCGKGVQAAQLSSMARHTLRADATDTRSPAVLLKRLHDAMVAQGADRFLTCAYAAFHLTDQGVVGTLALGGHPPALIRRTDGAVEQLGEPGTVLGVLPEPHVHLTDVPFTLAPGDLLLLYTDGAIEARPRTGTAPREAVARFEEADLARALVDTRGLDAVATVAHLDAVLEAQHGGRPSDDTALLALRAASDGPAR